MKCKKQIFFLFFLFLKISFSQIKSTDTILPSKGEKVKVTLIHHDTLSSSFHIIIPKEVALHKHLHHTEQVIILEGTGVMTLADKNFNVKRGDVILIPKNTPHSLKVTSKIPLRCISVQAPYFDGTDRVLLNAEEQKK
jgi:mannose-6-phosphate isomerase-like protein (cupin superfamily)